MDFFTGSNDLGTLGLGLLIAGVVTGLVSGLSGIGGGLVLVPVLYLVFASAGVLEGARMHLAVGTALASLIPISLAACRLHSSGPDRALVKRWILPVALGVAAGAVLSALVPGQALALLFALLALMVAPYLAFGGETWRVTAEPPRSVAGAVLAFGIGALGALTAIGFERPALRLCGVGEPQAGASASVFAAVIAVAGGSGAVLAGLGHAYLPIWSFGFVNLMALAILAPVTIAAWAFGAHYADTVDVKRLRPIFGLLVAVIALKMVWDVLR